MAYMWIKTLYLTVRTLRLEWLAAIIQELRISNHHVQRSVIPSNFKCFVTFSQYFLKIVWSSMPKLPAISMVCVYLTSPLIISTYSLGHLVRKLTAKTRNFKGKAANKKEDQKLENTSNQYFFDKTFKRKNTCQRKEIRPKAWKAFKSILQINTFSTKYWKNMWTLRIAPFYPRWNGILSSYCLASKYSKSCKCWI